MITPKTPAAVRSEAVRLAREAAKQRERDGDPEGAGVLRDLAADIARIKLRSVTAGEALRELRTGASVGEGHPVTYRDDKREVACWLDSWSLGARVVWLRTTPDRVPEGRIFEAKPHHVDLYVGFRKDAQP